MFLTVLEELSLHKSRLSFVICVNTHTVHMTRGLNWVCVPGECTCLGGSRRGSATVATKSRLHRPREQTTLAWQRPMSFATAAVTGAGSHKMAPGYPTSSRRSARPTEHCCPCMCAPGQRSCEGSYAVDMARAKVFAEDVGWGGGAAKEGEMDGESFADVMLWSQP